MKSYAIVLGISVIVTVNGSKPEVNASQQSKSAPSSPTQRSPKDERKQAFPVRAPLPHRPARLFIPDNIAPSQTQQQRLPSPVRRSAAPQPYSSDTTGILKAIQKNTLKANNTLSKISDDLRQLLEIEKNQTQLFTALLFALRQTQSSLPLQSFVQTAQPQYVTVTQPTVTLPIHQTYTPTQPSPLIPMQLEASQLYYGDQQPQEPR